ncbi:hypothetical protein ES332_A07G126800v1 [Gossypium tomentosum]|uniref:Uncharacterized protein n=1 Tax=Gossypium tomentosum TaxID=34277 RepID=A0A5D2PUF0_GOSTO|nr:hypothetical protein ES332_A07G126800v1 [Gossypium tomentosum]
MAILDITEVADVAKDKGVDSLLSTHHQVKGGAVLDAKHVPDLEKNLIPFFCFKDSNSSQRVTIKVERVNVFSPIWVLLAIVALYNFNLRTRSLSVSKFEHDINLVDIMQNLSLARDGA